MKNIFRLMVLWLALGAVGVKAQTDTTLRDFEKEFMDFKKSIRQDFDHFKSENDSVFYTFLKESWQTFRLFKDHPGTAPKPEVQPELKDKKRAGLKIKPLIKKSISVSPAEPLFAKKPVPFETKEDLESENYTSFDFFGEDIKIPKKAVPKTSKEGAMNRKVADFFKQSSADDALLRTVAFLENNAYEKRLNGWGYLNMVYQASKVLYHNRQDRIMFVWFALLQSGFDVRLGYDDRDVYLMAHYDVPVYFSAYFELKGKKYYIVLFDGQQELDKQVSSYKADYPGKQKPVTLAIDRNLVLAVEKDTRTLDFLGEKVKIACNKNLIDFYQTYPVCDLSVYFPVSLSPVALKSLDEFMQPHLAGKDALQKLNFLLKFVQYAIRYKTDEQQFGTEKYFFAEETLFYPYADCEDRVVLLSQLVKRYLDVPGLALLYDGHVSYAVNLEGQRQDGAFVKYEGKRYYIADPTYIGAEVGMMMDHYKNEVPEIIAL